MTGKALGIRPRSLPREQRLFKIGNDILCRCAGPAARAVRKAGFGQAPFWSRRWTESRVSGRGPPRSSMAVAGRGLRPHHTGLSIADQRPVPLLGGGPEGVDDGYRRWAGRWPRAR